MYKSGKLLTYGTVPLDMSIPIDFLKRPSFFSTASLRNDTSFPFMYKAHLKATLHFEIVAKGNNKKVSSFLVNCKK